MLCVCVVCVLCVYCVCGVCIVCVCVSCVCVCVLCVCLCVYIFLSYNFLYTTSQDFLKLKSIKSVFKHAFIFAKRIRRSSHNKLLAFLMNC